MIISEPSNPWVSGVSGLFTTEFYSRVRSYLIHDGVFGQWIHVYELDDALVLSVLAALHQNFRLLRCISGLARRPAHRGQQPAPAAGAGLVGLSVSDATEGPLRLRRAHARRARRTSDRRPRRAGPLLEAYGANSDFYPVLDLGAERRRFRRDFAVGFPTLSAEWFNVLASLKGARTAPVERRFRPCPRFPGFGSGRSERCSGPGSSWPPTDSAFGPVSRDAMYRWNQWQAGVGPDQPPGELGGLAGAGQRHRPATQRGYGRSGG